MRIVYKETPVPIPNTAVKLVYADGTAGNSPWESKYCQGVKIYLSVHFSFFMQRQFLLKNNFNFHIVLYQPDIPPNTGNIARLCVATNSYLHIIKPMGFALDDKHLKRAGLDYWKHLHLIIHNSIVDFFNFSKGKRIFFATTKAKNTLFDKTYALGDMFMFGSETKGLPEYLLEKYFDYCINIPTTNNVRSINLSDSVSIVLYEAIRQISFSR